MPGLRKVLCTGDKACIIMLLWAAYDPIDSNSGQPVSASRSVIQAFIALCSLSVTSAHKRVVHVAVCSQIPLQNREQLGEISSEFEMNTITE